MNFPSNTTIYMLITIGTFIIIIYQSFYIKKHVLLELDLVLSESLNEYLSNLLKYFTYFRLYKDELIENPNNEQKREYLLIYFLTAMLSLFNFIKLLKKYKSTIFSLKINKFMKKINIIIEKIFCNSKVLLISLFNDDKDIDILIRGLEKTEKIYLNNRCSINQPVNSINIKEISDRIDNLLDSLFDELEELIALEPSISLKGYSLPNQLEKFINELSER